jgi:thiosulfate/3-mercaptopyruvate sulfurtransferase
VTPVVSAGWLASHRGEVKVVDGRWYVDGRSGLDAYHAGHLPGAVWVDLDRDLSGPAGGAGVGRHPLPDPADFAAALGRLGVGEGQPVVVYDDAGGSIAARLWWMLHVLGEPVAVLDGGLPAWPGPLETGRGYAVAPVTRTVRPWPPGRFVDVDHVLDAGQVLVDARATTLDPGTSPARATGRGPAISGRTGGSSGRRSYGPGSATSIRTGSSPTADRA